MIKPENFNNFLNRDVAFFNSNTITSNYKSNLIHRRYSQIGKTKKEPVSSMRHLNWYLPWQWVFVHCLSAQGATSSHRLKAEAFWKLSQERTGNLNSKSSISNNEQLSPFITKPRLFRSSLVTSYSLVALQLLQSISSCSSLSLCPQYNIKLTFLIFWAQVSRSI